MRYSIRVVFVLLMAAVVSGAVVAQTIKTETLTEPFDDAETARVTIIPALADLTVTALADPDTLMQAEIGYVGTLDYRATGTTDREISLIERLRGNLGSLRGLDERPTWAISLSPNALLDLRLESGRGTADLNLRDLQLTRLDFDLGGGSAIVALPAREEPVILNTDIGSGDMTLTLPTGGALTAGVELGSGDFALTADDDAVVRFVSLEVGSGDAVLDLGDHAELNIGLVDIGSGLLTIQTGAESAVSTTLTVGSGTVQLDGAAASTLSAMADIGAGNLIVTLADDTDAEIGAAIGSGSLTVDVPDNAAVRLEVIGNRRGNFTLLPGMEQIQGGDDTGIWTVGRFDDARTTVVITVDTRSGSIILR